MNALRLASLALLIAPVTTACLGNGSVNAYGGTRSLDSDEVDELDDQIVYGLDVVLDMELPFLELEGGWLHAEEDSSASGGLTNVELATDEYFVGLRLAPWRFLIEPYASAGVSWLDGDFDSDTTSDSDGVLGYYARLGAAITFGIVRFGLDGRWLLGTDVEFDNIEAELDNFQIAAFVGIGF